MDCEPSRGTRLIVLLLFLVSGGCTLAYQIVWVRMLVPVFGTSGFAVSTVLAAFMAGLALGSAVFGRTADRARNGLRIYAWLELSIGLFALIVPWVLPRLDALWVAASRHLLDGAYPLILARFVLVFSVLLIPTTLMGGTLPVLVKFVTRRLGRVGWSIGRLYAINTLGAAGGSAVTAFLLLERLGVGAATYVAATINLLVAAIAFLVSRHAGPDRAPVPPQVAVQPAHTAVQPAPAAVEQLGSWAGRAVFWGFALSGFAALGYEVLWTRLLSTVLGITTVQSLSVILVVFLFGLAAGGAVGARLVDRLERPLSVFGIVELLLGLFGLASIAALSRIPETVELLDAHGGGLLRLLPLSPWTSHLLQVLLVAFTIMLVPTVLMGALFPLAGKLHARRLGDLGRRIGGIYAANTTGAIFGALAGGFVLIPWLGTQGGVQLLAWINLLVGAAALALDFTVRSRARGVLLTAGVTILLLAVLLPSQDVVGVLGRSVPGTELLYHDESAGGTVTVHEYPDGKRLLKVNGAGEVPTDHASIQTFRLLGNLPMLLHAHPDDVLVIAFGGGVTLSSVEAHRPRHLECVEVVAGVFDAAPYFERFNNGIHTRLDGPGLDLIVEDGRNHLLRTRRRYDVITADATHPATADSWVLYTKEFYELCRKRLKRGGIVTQWLPLHGLGPEDFRIVLRTFHSVFPHASLWLTRGYAIMLGTPDTLRIDIGRLQSRMARQAVWPALAEVELEDPFALLATLVLDEAAVARFVGTGKVNSDDRPHTSFSDRWRTGTETGLPALASLTPYVIERADHLLAGGMTGAERRLERRLQARRHALRGFVALKLGRREVAMRELQLARETDPAERNALRTLSNLERARRHAVEAVAP